MDHRVNGHAPGHDGARLPATWPVRRFLAGINWANREAARPAPLPAAPPVAGRRVRDFLTLVNWTNAVRAADDDGPTLNLQSLDTVLAEFVWD